MFQGVAAPLTPSKMITIEKKTTVLIDGEWVGCIPAKRWNAALLALGATGGFWREEATYTAAPMPRYRPMLIRTLKRLVA